MTRHFRSDRAPIRRRGPGVESGACADGAILEISCRRVNGRGASRKGRMRDVLRGRIEDGTLAPEISPSRRGYDACVALARHNPQGRGIRFAIRRSFMHAEEDAVGWSRDAGGVEATGCSLYYPAFGKAAAHFRLR